MINMATIMRPIVIANTEKSDMISRTNPITASETTMLIIKIPETIFKILGI
jgi:hypothetical protein